MEVVVVVVVMMNTIEGGSGSNDGSCGVRGCYW